MATGRPVETDVVKAIRANQAPKLWPNPLGTKNWEHAAFDPNRGLLYVNTLHMWATYKLNEEMGEHKPGGRWTGYQELKISPEPGEPKGFMEAIDPLTGKAKWKGSLDDHANWSSMLATAGGLLFTGRHTGEFIALDADTGKQLWQFQTSSGINSNPVTWSYKGKQYVTVLSGLGGVGRRFIGDVVKSIPNGGSVWTFALSN